MKRNNRVEARNNLQDPFATITALGILLYEYLLHILLENKKGEISNLLKMVKTKSMSYFQIHIP